MNKKRFRKIAVYVAGILSFVICGFLYSCSSNGNVYTIEQPNESVTLYTEEDGYGVHEESSESNTSGVCYVYVCGHVINPGVYEVSSEARVYELIDMAGGASSTGCLEALNLADHIYDGQKIYVPDYEEYASAPIYADYEDGKQTYENADSGLVNINTADIQQLMTLPGVGQSRAQAIVDYRNEHGSFACIEDIMNVSGIKEAAFSKLKDYICIK